MGFWKKLFGKKQKTEERESAAGREESWDAGIIRRDEINMDDAGQREKFVNSCLEQIRDAEKEMDQLAQEYGMVTAYLTDMEEIEALPDAEKRELRQAAEKICSYEKEKKLYQDRPDHMPEQKYHQMERMEGEAEEALGKLTDCENYQVLIRQDLSRLSGERHAFGYRKHELLAVMANMRGMAVICSCAFAACIGMLLVLQLAMDMDVQLGYLFSCAAAAGAIFVIYMKYTEASRELKKVENALNRLILLQNRVKIRYVNNTQLMEYLRVKYGVASAQELSDMWEQYNREKEEREKYQQIHEELIFYQKELVRILRRYRIQDADIWVHQAEAVINRNEMVEIRHNLILRRQKLRKRMEYNQDLAQSAKQEVMTLAEEFPRYAQEIMRQVSLFEK